MNKVVQQGMNAFKVGVLTNPYNEGTNKHKQWEFGFNQAYFSNLRKVKEFEQKRKNLSRRS